MAAIATVTIAKIFQFFECVFPVTVLRDVKISSHTRLLLNKHQYFMADIRFIQSEKVFSSPQMLRQMTRFSARRHFPSSDNNLLKCNIANIYASSPSCIPENREFKRHNAIFAVTVGTTGCRNDNLRCQHWRQSWHRNNSQFSTIINTNSRYKPLTAPA